MYKLAHPVVLIVSVVGCFTFHAAAQQPAQLTETPGDSSGQTPTSHGASDVTKSASEPSSSTLEQEAVTETDCSDRIDNDDDGAVDCADLDCDNDLACKPEPEPTPEPKREPVAQPAPAASMQLHVSPKSADTAKTEQDKATEALLPEKTVGIEATIGVAARVGAAGNGYEVAERAGLLWGLGALYGPSRKFAFGLSYAYTNLGSERLDPSVSASSASIDRKLHSLSLLGRGYPLRTDTIGLWAGLHLGINWQTANAHGTLRVSDFPSGIRTFSANVGPDAGMFLGGGIGFDLELGGHFAMLSSVNFTHHRTTSDPLYTNHTAFPVAGMGAVSQLDLRLALQYRFDVTETTKSPASVSGSMKSSANK